MPEALESMPGRLELRMVRPYGSQNLKLQLICRPDTILPIAT